MTIWVCNPWWSLWIFLTPFPWAVFKNNLPTSFVLGSTRFSPPLYLQYPWQKYLIFLCLKFPVQEFLPLFSIIISLWLSWYTILFIIPYLWPCKNSLSVNFRADIHSHQLAPPPWRFLYLTFELTLFRATLHVSWRCPLQCELSCSHGPRKMYQSTYTHL